MGWASLGRDRDGSGRWAMRVEHQGRALDATAASLASAHKERVEMMVCLPGFKVGGLEKRSVWRLAG